MMLALAVAFGIATSACGGPQMPPAAMMTSQEIQAHGTATFHAPEEKVFAASVDALKVLGYQIAAERKEKGLIVTNRKLVREVAASQTSVVGYGGVASATSTAVSAGFFRQYTLELRSLPDGAVKVTATPAVFENAADISSQQVWDLDGPVGERELWRQLFAKIQTLL